MAKLKVVAEIEPKGNFPVVSAPNVAVGNSTLDNVISGIDTDIGNKVDKVSGKGLSTNDYTTAEKNKLAGIANNANNYVHPTTSGNKHIPNGGSSGKILGWSADGTAAWVDPTGGGAVETVYIGSTEYAPDANGKVTLPAYPSDTNTYVSAASFADNTSSSSNNPLKMTLSRSGTLTTPVTATLPKISSSTAGVVPKGSSVSSQSQSTKFLREDGTWAAPSYSESSTFTISRYSGSYTVDAETWKSNGMAWFTILIKNTNQINANTSTIPAYVPSDLKPKGSRDINLVCDVDNKYCRAWITGGSQYIYIRSLENIPANSNIRITGCYPY